MAQDALHAVADDRSIFTALPDGTLEIRGTGWSRRLGRSRQVPLEDLDLPRVCRLGDQARAMRIAQMVAEQACHQMGSLTWI
jgi:hypothetical protein